MKTSRLILNPFLALRFPRPLLCFAGMAAGASLLGTNTALAVNWTGPGTDWNTPDNWGGAVPVGTSANINLSTPVATITANLVGIPTFIEIANGAAATGRVDHLAGTASTAASQDVRIGRNGGSGTYNLANTAAGGGALTGFGQGSGTLNVFRNLYVGGFTGGAASIGNLNVNTSGTLGITSQLLVGNSSSTGTVKIDSGTVTVGDAVEIGYGTGCTGTLSMSGGAITKTGATNFTIGGGATGGGHGTLNLSGGSVTSSGIVRVAHGAASDGTLNVTGGTLNLTNDIWVGSFTGSTGKVNLSGGTISGTSWVTIGRKDTADTGIGGTGTITMTGGTWSKTGDSNFIVGASGPATMDITGGVVDVGPSTVTDRGITWVGEQNNCTGTLTISGAAEFRSARFTLGVQTGSTGMINLNGGTVKTSQFLGGGGTSTVNFNGSQIVASGNNSDFMRSLGNAVIGAGGLRVDTAGFQLDTEQSVTGTGGVIKTGAGSLNLAGSNDFAGTSQVLAGKLAFASDSTGLGDITVADGATLGVIQNQNISLSVANVTLGTAGATSLDFDLGDGPGNPNVAALNVTGALTLKGPVTIHISDAGPALGSFPLVKYVAPKSGTGSFSLVGLPLGVAATLLDNGAGLVTLEITSISFPKWTGDVDGEWDTTTENWEDILSSLPTLYADPAPVVFDDSALSGAITLNQTVSPGSVLFDNSSTSYSIEGTGKIAGPTGLTKAGTADLTLNTANTYTGATVLGSGNTYLNSIAAAGSPSSIGAASVSPSNLVLNGTALTYTGPAATTNRGFTIGATGTVLTNANSLEFGGQVASTDGNLVKNGAGNLTLSYNGANLLGTVNQGIKVEGGTLTLRGAGAQTNSVAGELWVADLPDLSADLVLDHTSLTMPSWLALGRGNGNSGVCHMTATDSTIQTTNFSTGYNNNLAANNSQTFLTIHNTVWNNGGVTYLAESSGSQGELTLTGTTKYNPASNFLAAVAATTKGTVTLSDSSSITKTGGYTSIGVNGDGFMTVQNSASFTSLTGDFNISDIGTSTGILTLKDTASINVTNVFIGKGSGTKGTMNQSGGSFQSGSWISIGRFNSGIGIVNITAGTMTSTGNLVVGEAGTGTLNVSGSAVVTSNGDALYLGFAGGSGTLNLNGGTVVAKRLAETVGGNSTVNFDGGTLKATPTANSVFLTGLDSVTILAGGATIDTSGQNLTISQAMGGTGGLAKSGTGMLTLAGSNTYKGATSVTTGTLSLATAFLDDNAAVNIASGALLDLPHGLTDQVGSLTIAGSPAAPGLHDKVSDPTAISGTGKLLVSGAVISPYDTWINSFAGIPANKKGKNDDPDNDGQSNIAEFALGGTPNSGSNNSRVYSIVADGSVDADAQKELLMTVAVLQGTPAFAGSPPTAAMSGVSYVIQGSETLGSFPIAVTPVATVAPPAPNATPPAGYEYRTFSLNGSNGTTGKGFLRVKVDY